MNVNNSKFIKKTMKILGRGVFALGAILAIVSMIKFGFYAMNKEKILEDYKEIVNINEKYKKIDGLSRKDIEGFDLEKYTFPFSNFSSDLSPGGNCEGMTYYVLKNFLYEKKEIGNLIVSDFDSKILYNDGNIKADLSEINSDIDYENILKKAFRLKSNKSNKEWNYSSEIKFENKELESILSDISNIQSNREYMNYSVYETNPYYSSKVYLAGLDIYENRKSATPQLIVDLIDSNKPVMLGLATDNIGGHALLAYGYERIDDNNIKVYVYDSNLPFKKELSTEYNNIYMLFTKDLDSENWCYIYRPTIEGKAIYSNYNSVIPGSNMCIYYNYEY